MPLKARPGRSSGTESRRAAPAARPSLPGFTADSDDVDEDLRLALRVAEAAGRAARHDKRRSRGPRRRRCARRRRRTRARPTTPSPQLTRSQASPAPSPSPSACSGLKVSGQLSKPSKTPSPSASFSASNEKGGPQWSRVWAVGVGLAGSVVGAVRGSESTSQRPTSDGKNGAALVEEPPESEPGERIAAQVVTDRRQDVLVPAASSRAR